VKWSFNGFREWPAGEGQLGLLEGFDVFAASDVAALGREFCEQCVCWRVFGTCVTVQVEDWEEDALTKQGGGYEGVSFCTVYRNCCPVLFFDFIGVKLPVLETGGDE
jgi:hypothetical protein